VDQYKLKRINNSDGSLYGWRFWCPGCESNHAVSTKWAVDEAACTISPSILVHPVNYPNGMGGQPRCHSFVRNGSIEFLADCDHELAGKTVELGPVDV
jgi:hypothetical protein